MDYKILLVDDEDDILDFMSYNLIKEGYIIQTATNGKLAVEKALEFEPHLILLDMMMPVMDGMQACSKIRENPKFSNTIIAFLTARDEDNSQIAAFEAGADDYIAKPVRVNVLVSRIKALLKRLENNQPTAESEGKNSGLKIDEERFVVLKDGEELVLPRKEFKLFHLLYSKPQKVFSREEIFSKVWGDDVVVGDRTIDVHIRKLREKLGDKHIITIKGVGYKYQEE